MSKLWKYLIDFTSTLGLVSLFEFGGKFLADRAKARNATVDLIEVSRPTMNALWGFASIFAFLTFLVFLVMTYWLPAIVAAACSVGFWRAFTAYRSKASKKP